MLLPAAPHLDSAIIRDPAVAEPIWRDLMSRSPAFIYQSPDFLLPWLEIYGRATGIEPLFILLRDLSGPVLMMPLGVRRFGPCTIAECLGGKHANFNLPVFDPPRLGGDAPAICAAFVSATRQSGIDLLVLANQPQSWRGVANPLRFERSLPSPSFGYALALEPDADLLIQRVLSKERRRKLRQKLKWLGDLGTVVFEEALDPVAQQVMLNTYFQQKSERFDAQGVTDPFADPAIRRWLGALAAFPSGQALRLFGLKLDQTYVAIWGVGQHDGVVSGMITSFAGSEALQRCSPGDLLLEWMLRRLCAEGVSQFDFGVGEAQYKSIWSDETIPLFDTHLGLTAKGAALSTLLQAKTRLKRAIKQSPRLMTNLKKVRQFWR